MATVPTMSSRKRVEQRSKAASMGSNPIRLKKIQRGRGEKMEIDKNDAMHILCAIGFCYGESCMEDGYYPLVERIFDSFPELKTGSEWILDGRSG